MGECNAQGGTDIQIRVLLDSGAYSWFMKNRNKIDGGTKYYKTAMFKKYFDDYCGYLTNNKNKVHAYIGLDIINNPQATYDIVKDMCSMGFNPVPVVHPGTDIKWFKKYLDMFEYVGLGGLGAGAFSMKQNYYKFADECFSLICDKNGKPSVRVHGFAMTSPDLILRYPWYSIDSTTWAKAAGYGGIRIPSVTTDGQTNFLAGRVIGVSNRSLKRSGIWHLDSLPKTIRVALFGYIKNKVRVSPSDLEWDHQARRIVCAYYYRGLEKQIKQIYGSRFMYEGGGNIMLAGVGGSGMIVGNFKEYEHALLHTGEHLNFLETFFYKKCSDSLIQFATEKYKKFIYRRCLSSAYKRRRLENGKD